MPFHVRQENSDSTEEVVQVGNLCEHVVAEKEVGPAPLRGKSLAEGNAEEVDARGYPTGLGRFGDVRRRIHAEDRIPSRRSAGAGSRR